MGYPAMVTSVPSRAPTSPSSHHTPFRFKSTRTKKRSCSPLANHSYIPSSHHTVDPSSNLEETESNERSKQGHRKHHHKHKRRRRSTSTPKDPIPDDPEGAFRESLFDAMADDEGAEFWSRVYGAPAESFQRSFLDSMSEEEYAAYVRDQMWHRTPEYLASEKQRKDRDRAAAKLREEEKLKAARRRKKRADYYEREKEEIKSRWGEQGEDWDNEVDSVLSKRTAKKTNWERAWRRYLRGWEELGQSEGDLIDLGTTSVSSSAPQTLQLLIPYPLLSGMRRDITTDTVSEFLQNCPPQLLPDAPNRSSHKHNYARDTSPSSSAVRSLHKMQDVEAVLKAERLRWHPDKIQQRFGPKYPEGLDAESMKVVTEIFQIVDALLGRIRVKLEDAGKSEGKKAGTGGGEPHRFW